MDDRELLELAAKAHGFIDDQLSEEDDLLGLRRNGQGIYYIVHKFGCHNWKPLTDDGDALRLAVKLCISIEPTKEGTAAISADHEQGSINRCTLRAIVNVAAAIGKEMP